MPPMPTPSIKYVNSIDNKIRRFDRLWKCILTPFDNFKYSEVDLHIPPVDGIKWEDTVDKPFIPNYYLYDKNLKDDKVKIPDRMICVPSVFDTSGKEDIPKFVYSSSYH